VELISENLKLDETALLTPVAGYGAQFFNQIEHLLLERCWGRWCGHMRHGDFQRFGGTARAGAEPMPARLVVANRVDWAAGVIGLPKRVMEFPMGQGRPIGDRS
jgi:hypothetical protein